MNMDHNPLHEYVLSIYEYRSMTRAAQSLGISQPALSSGLSNLEQKLGFRLFDRRSKPITPTPEGMIFIEYIQQVKQMQKTFVQKITDLRDSESGELSAGAPVVYAESILAPTAAELYRLHPKIKIRVEAGSFSELIQKVQAEQLDCFISTSGELPDSFTMHELRMERLYLCIPRAWEINRELEPFAAAPDQPGKCFDYKILQGHAFLSLGSKQPLQREINRFFQENDISPRNCITVNQVSLGIHLAALGVGITIASEEALFCSKYAPELCIYPLPSDFSGRTLYIAYSEKHYMSTICKEYIELVKKRSVRK